MKLYLNATSPYARVARIAAMEKGLESQVSLVTVDPWSNDDQLLRVNPLAKVPALVTDTGQSVTESLFILSYLDQLTEQTALFPSAQLADVLQLAGIAQGIIDTSFTTVIARKHEGETADNTVLGQRRLAAIKRALASLNQLVMDANLPAFSAGHIITGVALEYLDFRLPEIDWRDTHSDLSQWAKDVTARESFLQTAFICRSQ